MAIDFDATSEDSTHGTGISLTDPFTILAWIKLNSVSAADRQLLGQDQSTSTVRIILGDATGTGRFRVRAAFSGGSADARSATGTLSANIWQYIGFKMDQSDSQDGRLYVGDLTPGGLAVEPTYADSQNGSGSFNSTSGNNLRVGNAAAQNITADSIVAWVAIWPSTALTLGQIQAQQFFLGMPIVPGCELFTHYGIDSATGTQPDWSGSGNNGTITGTPTLADHVPIPIMLGDSWVPQEAAPAVGDVPSHLWEKHYIPDFIGSPSS